MKRLLQAGVLALSCCTPAPVVPHDTPPRETYELRGYDDILSQLLFAADSTTTRYMFRTMNILVRKQTIGGTSLEFKLYPLGSDAHLEFVDDEPFGNADTAMFCSTYENCVPLSPQRADRLFSHTHQLFWEYFTRTYPQHAEGQILTEFHFMEQEAVPGRYWRSR